MYKQNLALNNQRWLICHKTQPNQSYWNAKISWVLILSSRESIKLKRK